MIRERKTTLPFCLSGMKRVIWLGKRFPGSMKGCILACYNKIPPAGWCFKMNLAKIKNRQKVTI